LGLSEDEFVIGLMEAKGVFVHPGYFYDNEIGLHFVISFLTKEEKLLEGVKSLVSFIEEQ
jgi:aspartate/methionine/tyrosine aminotransferase